MGITKYVLVCFSGHDVMNWYTSVAKHVRSYVSRGNKKTGSLIAGAVYMPQQAEKVLLYQQKKDFTYYLFRGFLAHELGHVLHDTGERSFAEEAFADSCVPYDRHILRAMRDQFFMLHKQNFDPYCPSSFNLSASYLEKYDAIHRAYGDYHPSYIRRACYFNKRLTLLKK
jgi:hypothetical protein